VRRLDALVARLGRESRTDLCLAYVRAQPWITSTVLGMETLSQLHENVALSLRPQLTDAEIEMVEAEMEGAPEALLDPAAWPPAAREG
jgi:aryl-alcohol dehydrogenase-like predicted oxidoreductase